MQKSKAEESPWWKKKKKKTGPREERVPFGQEKEKIPLGQLQVLVELHASIQISNKEVAVKPKICHL